MIRWAFARMGVMMIMWGTVLTSVIYFFVVSYYVNKHLNYSLGELTRDLMPSVLLCLAMGAGVYAISWLHLQVMLQLLVQVLCGVGIYVAGSWLFRVDSFQYMLDAIRTILGKKTIKPVARPRCRKRKGPVYEDFKSGPGG